MTDYERKIFLAFTDWEKKMTKRSSIVNRVSKTMQTKVNEMIPEKVHEAITASIKTMINGVLTGSSYMDMSKGVEDDLTLEERERKVVEIVKKYRTAAVIEGAGTGAGGIWLGLTDFPLLLTIKMKCLFDMARAYGFHAQHLHERVFILHLFQLAYSSDEYRREIFERIKHWDSFEKQIPNDVNECLNWRKLQQEYRDTIDFVKMLQLVPGIGAFVGAAANYRLLEQLKETAMNGYRMRLKVFSK